MEQVKRLKCALAEMQTKKNNSEETSYDGKPMSKGNKSSSNNSNEESMGKSQPLVGGYFGSIFK
jgi:hypothetical protein